MNYLLTVLTNGRRDCLERSLAAFIQNVRPLPEKLFLMDDGGRSREAVFNANDARSLQDIFAGLPFPSTYESSPHHGIGMCKAHAHCWDAASRALDDGIEWVFHLQDDFVILRPVYLPDLAHVLMLAPEVKQMALVRGPRLGEIPFGGYMQQSPVCYERYGAYKPSTDSAGRRLTPMDIESVRLGDRRRADWEWIQTRRNWATNPALFRTSLAREFPWPLDDGCETAIGPNIISSYPDAQFGLWGWGESWCSHIGVDRAPGAKGY